MNIPLNLMCEHLVHQPLIRGAWVLEFEWHYFVAEETLADDEWSLLLISLVQLDLVVTRKRVDEA